MANETFRWIDENLKDEIDFVIWTGDSARHDNDEAIPRGEDEILRLNELMVEKFVETFSTDPNSDDSSLSVPIVPTFGNNDIMPHNIFEAGPNLWTKKFVKIWDKFISEEQRHAFVQGGWFTSELIPGKLAAISLNTMYFFDNNHAVDGCDAKSEPGYEHMEWLRVQLERLRERGMAVILMGHVPPARSSTKQSWEESCWQKYTLWVHQYRDIIVGSIYGHMNIDHFMLQDSHDIEIAKTGDENAADYDDDKEDDDTVSKDISATSRPGYLSSLRREWSKLPSPPEGNGEDVDLVDGDYGDCSPETEKKRKSKNKFFKKIGGPYAERYSTSLVSPSVVPNYFPTLRVIEYNITGIENTPTWADVLANRRSENERPSHESYGSDTEFASEMLPEGEADSNKKKKKKKGPHFKVPPPPSRTAPPGPAYSNQALSWLRYTQYFANLTRINNEIAQHGKKHKGNGGFKYEVEYNTQFDKEYKLKDLTVLNFFKLASRIAKGDPDKNETTLSSFDNEASIDIDDEAFTEDSSNDSTTGCAIYEGHETCDDGNEYDERRDNNERKKKKQNKRNRSWETFLSRAFVGYLDIDEIEDELGGAR